MPEGKKRQGSGSFMEFREEILGAKGEGAAYSHPRREKDILSGRLVKDEEKKGCGCLGEVFKQ